MKIEKKFTDSQRANLKEHFRDNIYYKLCKAIHDVFLLHNSTILLSTEQLFVDAVITLDLLIDKKDKEGDYCKELWSNTLGKYRDRDSNHAGMEVSMAEVAMFIYSVIFGLTSINKAHFKGTLCRILHESVYRMWQTDKIKHSVTIEPKLRPAVNVFTEDLIAWMKEYFDGTERLTKEISEVLTPPKANKNKKINEIPKDKTLFTLKYNCKDEVLRVKRINFVRRKWEEWGWIEKNTDVKDFECFFGGQPRDCQLKWKSSSSVLYLLISELLKQRKIFAKQTGCSARSVILNQFNVEYDNHKNRVDDTNKLRIEWSVEILNYFKPLNLPQLSYHQGEDISDAALQEVFTNNLHITKDLNKYT